VVRTTPQKEAWGPEPNDEIELQPEQVHRFVEDVAGRWPFMFPPGRLELSVRDEDVKPEVSSNVVVVHVEFLQASFDQLLQWVDTPLPQPDPKVSKSDDGVPGATRAFAARWLRHFIPTFQWFDVPQNQEQAQHNARALSEARKWIEVNRDRPEVLAEIRRLNTAQ